jgi:hypothetical protein
VIFSPQAGPSNSRSTTTRNVKRPQYNEDSDDEKQSRESRKKQPRLSHSTDQEQSSNEDGEPSISSRGRIRKVSKRYNM